MSNCNLCDHHDKESLEMQIARGALLKSRVAKDLEMKVNDVILHMDEHFARVVNNKGDISTPDDIKRVYDKRNILQSTVSNIADRLTIFLEKDGFSTQETTQIIKMAAELRQQIETLAKLEGELKEEHHYTLIQFNQLRAKLLNQLCPNCQEPVFSETFEFLTP